MKKEVAYPSFMQAFLIWLKVAIYSFGGPTNQIAVMHRLIVEEKQWIGEKRFLHALNYCMLLPGPEAHQLAIYLGWLLHSFRGGIIAGSLFVLPGFLSILALSILYAKYQSIYFVQIIFYGIKAGVIAIVFDALIRMSKKTLIHSTNIFIALAAFVGIFFFNIPFPIIIIFAAMSGFLMGRFQNRTFAVTEKNNNDISDLVANNPHISSRTISQTLFITALWLFIWFLPVYLILQFFGMTSVFAKEALFFSKTAIVTFGGAYSVLAYIAQQSVQYYGWLKPGEMLDGLGMAETTPGPLIQVVQFIGFLAAYRYAGMDNPLFAGLLGSIISTWVTFIPSFLWVFAGAPYIEKLRKITALHAAMTAITAAVVGVILNLSVWFSIHTLFHTVNTVYFHFLRLYIPEWHTFDIGSFFIMLFALIMVFRYKAGIFGVLFSSVVLGFIFSFIQTIFNLKGIS